MKCLHKLYTIKSVSNALLEYGKSGLKTLAEPKTTTVPSKKFFTIEKIVSPIPSNTAEAEPLELKWIFSEPWVNFSQLYVTVHKGKGRVDRLALYFRENGKYLLLKAIEADRTLSSFHKPNFFRYDFDSTTRKTFLHVPMIYHGTGGFRKDRVFCFEPGLTATVVEVDFESASKTLSAYLNEGERPTSYAYYDFTDDSLKFAFYIFKDSDSVKIPTGGYVSGTYKITKKREARCTVTKRDGIPPILIRLGWPVKYEMKVDTFRREPVDRDRYGFHIERHPRAISSRSKPSPPRSCWSWFLEIDD